MREISCSEITNTVAELCVLANKQLPCELANRIAECAAAEEQPLAKSIMTDIKNNIEAAKQQKIPICQDTGMAVIFAEVGQDVHIVGGNFEEAVNKGVSLGYTQGLLRK